MYTGLVTEAAELEIVKGVSPAASGGISKLKLTDPLAGTERVNGFIPVIVINTAALWVFVMNISFKLYLNREVLAVNNVTAEVPVREFTRFLNIEAGFASKFKLGSTQTS